MTLWYHGATARHSYLEKGTWFTTTPGTAFQFAWFRAQDRGYPISGIGVFVCDDKKVRIEEEVNIGSGEHWGTGLHNIPEVFTEWISFADGQHLCSEELRYMFNHTTEIIDLTHLIRIAGKE